LFRLSAGFRACAVSTHKCGGGGPSIVHLFGYPTHIRVNLGCWQWSQAESTACNSCCGRAKMRPKSPAEGRW